MLRGRPDGRDHHRPLCLAVFVTLTVVTLGGSPRPAWPHTISALSWGHDPVGNTAVTIVAAEPIPGPSFRSYHLLEPPRAVVVIEGFRTSIDQDELIIEDRYVDRVRLVLHEDRSPTELLLVFDLVNDSARIVGLEHDENRLVVVIGVSSPAPTPILPTPVVVATAAPTAIPPVPTPSATPSPRPSPSPTATMAVEPTTSTSYPDRPAPPVLKPTGEETAPPPTAATPRQPRGLATPTPGAEVAIASRAVDVTTSYRGDGSTLLRITADGRLRQGSARYLEVAGEPARIVLTIRGISAPELPRSLDIGDPNIDRIRIIHDAETSEGELHFVLLLNDPGITVSELKQVGPHVVVLVAPVDP